MLCPQCSHDDNKVKASGPVQGATVVRRRRICNVCQFRWWTVEQPIETLKGVADAVKQGMDYIVGKNGDVSGRED